MSRKKINKLVFERFSKWVKGYCPDGDRSAVPKFAKSVGASPLMVRHWRAGKYLPNTAMLLEIKNNYEISIDWLLTGEKSSPPPTITIQSTPHFQTFHQDFSMNNYIPVKLLKDSVAGGAPREVRETDIDGYCLIFADKKWMPNDPENYTCARIIGRSMSPLLEDGDVVAIDHSQKDPKQLDKKMVAFRKDGKVTIKWLKFLEKGKIIVGIPQNKDDPSMDSAVSLQGEEINQGIVGKVVWWWAKR